MMNQVNILQKMKLGFSIRICSYDCLKATKTRLRKALIRAEFMFMMMLHCLSAMPLVTLMLAHVGVNASTVIGYICNFRGKWIVRIGACLAARIVSAKGGIGGKV
jgi:hypothetical protein